MNKETLKQSWMLKEYVKSFSRMNSINLFKALKYVFQFCETKFVRTIWI